MKINQTKICTKCGEEKHLDEFHKSKRNKDGHCCGCKICMNKVNNEYQKFYRKNYRKEYRKYHREYKKEQRSKNIQKSRIYQKKFYEVWKKRNPDRYKKLALDYYYRNRNEYSKKSHLNVLNLTDSYIRQRMIKGTILNASNIPKELLKVKREHIKLGRLLKGIKNEDNERGKRKTG